MVSAVKRHPDRPHHADPLLVPLPNGTQVTLSLNVTTPTGRVLPTGSVGRVVRTRGAQVDVLVVGAGTLELQRSQVKVLKEGQLRFALSRQAAWDALLPNVVLRAVVGSRAWGLAQDGSDTDHRGIMVLPFHWTVGLLRPPQELVSLDGSDTYWSVDKAVRQALRADPNTLELLFVDGVTATHEMGAWLLAERDAFVSQHILGSFGRYAVSQLHKLQQSSRLANHRALLLDWLQQDPALTLDDAARRLAVQSLGAAPDHTAAVQHARASIQQLYRSLFDQGLLPASDFSSLALFAATGARDVELPRELRPKNAYNLLRLIYTARDWLRTGVPSLRVGGALRQRLLDIKAGNVALEEVLAEAQAAWDGLAAAKLESPLPPEPDVERAHRVLARIGVEAARLAVQEAPGPFGRDAAPPPVAGLGEEGEP